MAARLERRRPLSAVDCAPGAGFRVSLDWAGLTCTVTSVIRIRYIMEYIYPQFDQRLRSNSFHHALAQRRFSVTRQIIAAALDGYCAWGCFSVFVSGRSLLKPILPQRCPAAISE